MNITYKFEPYAGSIFKDENGKLISFKDIKNNFYTLNGKRGKIRHKAYINVYEHGYSGGYDTYDFIYADTLEVLSLNNISLCTFREVSDWCPTPYLKWEDVTIYTENKEISKHRVLKQLWKDSFDNEDWRNV